MGLLTCFKVARRMFRPIAQNDAPETEPIIAPFSRFADQLERHHLTPVTIVDVGVAWGTAWLYDRWPNAAFYLVDPTPQCLPIMQEWATKLDATILNMAMGDVEGSITIKIPERHSHTSIFEEIGAVRIVDELTVPMRRYDHVIAENARRPILVKIDVQGAELRVLRGMGTRLKEVDAIIVEVSTLPTLRGAPDFADVMQFMGDNGFVLHDVIGALRRPLDGALAQIDAAFVPRTSPLRRDMRWSI